MARGRLMAAGTARLRKAVKKTAGRKRGESEPVTDARVRKYLAITEKALSRLKHVAPRNTHSERMAQDFLLMAQSYFSDAKHFYGKGALVDAFACVNYAHGWLDAGARLGLWDTQGCELFTV